MQRPPTPKKRRVVYGGTLPSRAPPQSVAKQTSGLDQRWEVEDLFAKLDKDDSGGLTREELEPLASRLKRDLLKMMDENDDEEISRPEFIRYFLRN